jgi:hypothetical protein
LEWTEENRLRERCNTDFTGKKKYCETSTKCLIPASVEEEDEIQCGRSKIEPTFRK